MATGSCDNRCTSGKEGTCQCSCAGANHGTAKKVWDVLRDGGTASIKGSGVNLTLQGGGPKDSDEITNVKVWNDALSTPVQTYRSEAEFVKDLGKFIRAGRTDIEATDAYNRRQIDIKKKSADELRTQAEASSNLTDKEVQKQIRALGATVKKVDGEYIVNVPGGKEATAYYTEDRKDALLTAKYMVDAKKRLGGVPDMNDRAPSDSFHHSGITNNGKSFVADETATRAWAHRSGQEWPGSTIKNHKIEAHFDRNDNLVDLSIDDGKTESDSLDGTELNAFLDDVHPRRKN